jgi:hypothetical protein
MSTIAYIVLKNWTAKVEKESKNQRGQFQIFWSRTLSVAEKKN